MNGMLFSRVVLPDSSHSTPLEAELCGDIAAIKSRLFFSLKKKSRLFAHGHAVAEDGKSHHRSPVAPAVTPWEEFRIVLFPISGIQT
jgi:hypothetical protein